jgi:hypothetical protein
VFGLHLKPELAKQSADKSISHQSRPGQFVFSFDEATRTAFYDALVFFNGLYL